MKSRLMHDWANLCSSSSRRALGLARLYERDGWVCGEPYWTGEEWKVPAARSFAPTPDTIAMMRRATGGKITALRNHYCAPIDTHVHRDWVMLVFAGLARYGDAGTETRTFHVTERGFIAAYGKPRKGES
jgi:hypothetical protein